MELTIPVLAFAAVALVVWRVFRPRENVVARRMNPGSATNTVQQRRLEAGPGRRLIAPLAGKVGSLLARLLPHRLIRSMDHLLVMANQPMSVSAFLGLWGMSLVIGGLAHLYISRTLELTGLFALGVTFGIVLVFGMGPYTMLRRRARKRQKHIVKNLPYALDLVVTCVEAGLGVDAAFANVTERTSGPISQTFSQYLKEVGLGRARRDALTNVANRTGVPDLIRIAASVAQAEEMGTTLGDVLRTQSEELRALRRQRAQEAAQRAPVWMTIPMIFCFLPAMAAVITVPSVINFLNLLVKLGLRSAG